MIFREDDKINYPKWSTIKYTFQDYPVKTISMIIDSIDQIIIGYAVIIFPTDKYFDYGDYGKYSKRLYLASFEVNPKRKGYGTILLKYIMKVFKSVILRPINNSAKFYQLNGGKIIVGDLLEGCTMIIEMQVKMEEYDANMLEEERLRVLEKETKFLEYACEMAKIIIANQDVIIQKLDYNIKFAND